MTELEREIAALDGVLGAQVETIDGSPVSVRLDLAEGSDPAAVAGAVQGVLRRHGLRSRVPETADGGGAGSGEGIGTGDQDRSPVADRESRDEEGSRDAGRGTRGSVDLPTETLDAAHHEPEPLECGLPDVDVPAPIASVTVRQERGGVDVVVETTGGRSESASSTSHPDEVARAVVSAVARLAGVRPPRLVEVTHQSVGGRQAVTVCIDRGSDDLAVGTVFEAGTLELAVARAVWAALTG